MPEGKWLSGLWPETPATEAARSVLTARLGAVRHYLPLAAGKAEEDVEYVHQLRVATRRAGAALRIFADLLPEKRVRRARRLLRKVRRAAGAARDWDVFLFDLTRSKAARSARARSAVEFLTGYALGHRTVAQAGLAEAAADQSESLADLAENLADQLTVPSSIGNTLAELGSAILPGLLKTFDEAAAAGPETPESLHQLRIAGKRLRYAMEVFSDCYVRAFRLELYPMVERLQGTLGTVQDCHVAIERLTILSKQTRSLTPATAGRVEPGLAAILRETQNRLRGEKRAFRSWMREWKKLTGSGFPSFLRPAEARAPGPVSRSRPVSGTTRPRASR